jgi:hypothetical protein
LKTPPATPYLLPPEHAIGDGPWVDADGQTLGDRLEHWDPFTEVDLFRSLELDLDTIRAGCRLNVDAAFALSTSWHSNRTRLSGAGPTVELGLLQGLVRAPLTLRIPGAAAGGRVALRTCLVLRDPGSGALIISPRREGAILWQDSTSIALEGGAARFPVTPIDFTESDRLPDRALWRLEWDPDALDAPVLGDLRLLVNSGNEVLRDALRSGSADGRSAVIRSFVMFDVARTLVQGALGNERFVEDPESFEEGSVGRMLFELLGLCWPSVPVKTLSSRGRTDAPRLEAELQAHFELLR